MNPQARVRFIQAAEIEIIFVKRIKMNRCSRRLQTRRQKKKNLRKHDVSAQSLLGRQRRVENKGKKDLLINCGDLKRATNKCRKDKRGFIADLE